MNETLLMHWFDLSGHAVVELAKISIFVVLSSYLSALAFNRRRDTIKSSKMQALEHHFAHGR
jgi:hypothetical protein